MSKMESKTKCAWKASESFDINHPKKLIMVPGNTDRYTVWCLEVSTSITDFIAGLTEKCAALDW